MALFDVCFLRFSMVLLFFSKFLALLKHLWWIILFILRVMGGKFNLNFLSVFGSFSNPKKNTWLKTQGIWDRDEKAIILLHFV